MIRLPQLLRWLLGIGFIFLVLFTSLRLCLFLFFGRQGHSFADAGGAFLMGLRYDLRTIAIILLPILLLGSIPLLHPFKNKGARIFWMTLLTIVSFVVVFFYMVDFAHYDYLTKRLNAGVLNYLVDAGISLNMVWQSYPVIRMVLALAVATLILVALIRYSYRRIGKTAQPVSKRTRIISSVVFFLVAGFFVFGTFRQYPLRWSHAFSLGDDYKANLALNPFETFFNTLKFRKKKFDEARLRESYAVLRNYYSLPQQTGNPVSLARTIQPADSLSGPRPNIILVICESFSGYKSSMWGNPLNTTPFFDSLCRQGIFFDHCFTPTYGTARGVWATITGTPDVEVSTTTASRNPLAVDQQVIINDFKGYEKFYFIGGSPTWANIAGLLNNNIKGLHLYEQTDFNAPKLDVWGISDKNLFLESNRILAKQTEPFFAIIQTADNHRPYSIPEEDRQEFIPRNVPPDSLKQFGFETLPEMNAFRYTDFCYRKFMEAAVKEAYFRNTIFVFIGDHGITGDAGTMFPRAWSDLQLTAEHVPLLFYSPARLQPQRSNKIGSQTDVMPTIAGLCKIPYTNTTLGKDLLDSTTAGFAFIYDPDQQTAGVIQGNYYFRKSLLPQDKKETLASIVNNEKPAADAATEKQKNDMRLLTDAIYETAQYLILNNKKRNDGAH